MHMAYPKTDTETLVQPAPIYGADYNAINHNFGCFIGDKLGALTANLIMAGGEGVYQWSVECLLIQTGSTIVFTSGWTS